MPGGAGMTMPAVERGRRLGLLLLTPEAITALLRLPEGIRVLGVQEERAWTHCPASVIVQIEDLLGERLPLVAEGAVIPVVDTPQ